MSKQFLDSSPIEGVVALDIDLKQLSTEINNIKFGESGYVFLMSKEGLVLAHPKEEYIGSDLIKKQEFWKEVSTTEKGFIKFNENGVEKYISYNTNSITGWKTGLIVDVSELTKEVLGMKKMFSIVIILLSLIVIMLSMFIGSYISKLVTGLKNVFEEASDGDFTGKADIKSNDEFGELGESFNLMTTHVSDLIKNVQNASLKVSETSGVLTRMTGEVSASSGEISYAIEEIAKGATEQAHETQDGAESIVALSGMIVNVSELIDETSELSNKTKSLGDAGLNIVDTLTEKSEQTKQSSNELKKVILEVDEGTKAISLITDTIAKITEQTNLLSLNARIEAARAGEAGRGFAVVAEEVRKLSEQSKKSTEDIEEIISSIKQKTQIAVNSTNTTSIRIQEQDIVVEETKEVFLKMIKSMDVLTRKIEEIKGFTLEIDNSKNKVVDGINNISAVSEETAAITEELSASSEQINASMENFTNHASNLQRLAEELNNQISQFKLS